MACELLIHRQVVLAVWGRPEVNDFARLEHEVAAIYGSLGPVVFVARVPSDADAPDERGRKAMGAMLDRFMEMVTSYHAVIEGHGFFAATKRTVLATAFLVAGKRHTYHVHARMDDVLGAVPGELRADVRATFEIAKSLGYLARGALPQPAAQAL